MLQLDDPRWKSLDGGYRIPYDASATLRALERADDPKPVWDQLWEELHHQGDVGVASYAAVPHIVRIAKLRELGDWNVFGLAITIECARLAKGNPSLPDWLRQGYSSAWRELVAFAIERLATETDEITIRQIFGVIAIGKGFVQLGRLVSEFDASELETIYNDLFGTSG